MNFLVMDSPIMKFFGRIGDIIVLNLIFVVTCLPVFTIGTALSALYTVTMKLVRGEDPSIVKAYLKAYRRNWKPATICWALMLLTGMLLFLDFRLAAVFQGGMYIAARLLLAVVLGIWVLLFLYLFPYIARFENTVFHSIKNALLLSAAHMPSTLLMLIISGGSVVLTLFTSRNFVIGSIVWVFVGFAVVAYVQSYLLCRIFVRYENI